MTDKIISTAIVNRSFGYYFHGADESLTIQATGSLTSVRNVGVYSGFDHTSVTLNGNLASEASSALQLFGAHADVNIGYGVTVSAGGISVNNACVATLAICTAMAILFRPLQVACRCMVRPAVF